MSVYVLPSLTTESPEYITPQSSWPNTTRKQRLLLAAHYIKIPGNNKKNNNSNDDDDDDGTMISAYFQVTVRLNNICQVLTLAISLLTRWNDCAYVLWASSRFIKMLRATCEHSCSLTEVIFSSLSDHIWFAKTTSLSHQILATCTRKNLNFLMY